MKNIVDAILQIGRLVKAIVEEYEAAGKPADDIGSVNKNNSSAK